MSDIKQQVYNKDAEISVLGCGISEHKLWSDIRMMVSANDFWFEQHRRIFRALDACYERHHKLDALLVIDQLDAVGELDAAGGAAFIASLKNQVPSTLNFRQYCDVVASASQSRQLAALYEASAASCYDKGIDAVELAIDVQKASAEIISSRVSQDDFHTLHDMGKEWEAQYLARESGQRDPYHRCGIGPVDDVVDGGFHFGRSYWVAGLSKMGKTKMAIALVNGLMKENRSALSLEYNKLREEERRTGESTLPDLETYIQKNGIVVEWYTAENTRVDLYQRLLSNWMGFPETALKRPLQHELGVNMDYQRKKINAQMEMSRLGFKVRQQSRPRLRDIVLNTKQRIQEVGHSRILVVIDYIQRVHAGHDGQGAEYRNVTEASMTLSGMAIELGVMGLYVAHFNRDGAQRAIPKPSNLRSSGQIEQDVDHLLIIHRPFWDDAHDSERAKFTVLWHALSRHSEPGQAYLEAHMDINRFVPWTKAVPSFGQDSD